MSDSDEPNEPDDPLPELIASMDQMAAMAPHFARLARGWYDAFEAEGFGGKEALYLTAVQLLQDPGRPS